MISREKATFLNAASFLLISQLIGCSGTFFLSKTPSPPTPPPPTLLPHQAMVKRAPSMPSWDYGELPRPRTVDKTSSLPHLQAPNTQVAQNLKATQNIQETQEVLIDPVVVAQTPAPKDAAPIAPRENKAASTKTATAKTKKIVSFRQGSFKPTWSQVALVRNVAAHASKAHDIKIVSRTDATKNRDKNKRLAMDRAVAVKWVLVKAGVSAERISIVSCENCSFEQDSPPLASKQVLAVSIEFDQVDQDQVVSLANLGNGQ
jgi:outer membrane protein OmpA-like peptidoglycan-associated protein